MDSEDYITNIHAYWKHSQKERKPENAPASKSQQSKWSAAVQSNSSRSTAPQPHDTYDQYLDHQSSDDEEKNPRHKGNRESRDQWYGQQEKTSRRKKKNKGQPDDDWGDYYEDDNFFNYYEDENFFDHDDRNFSD